MTLRILGIVVGTLFALFGPLELWTERRFDVRSVVPAISMTLLGVAFIHYGLTGRSRGPSLPAPVRIALTAGLGVLALMFGPYLLIKRASYGPVPITLCAAYVVSGMALLLGAFVQRRAGRPPNKSLDGTRGG